MIVFFQAEDGIRDIGVTGVQTCALPISKSFAATWEMNGQVSWIEVRLSSDPDGRSRFELEHVAHVDDDMWAQFGPGAVGDRKSTRLNSSHANISYAVFCLKKKKTIQQRT